MNTVIGIWLIAFGMSFMLFGISDMTVKEKAVCIAGIMTFMTIVIAGAYCFTGGNQDFPGDRRKELHT